MITSTPRLRCDTWSLVFLVASKMPTRAEDLVPAHIPRAASRIRPSRKIAIFRLSHLDEISVKNSQTHSVTENSISVTPTLRKEASSMNDS